MCCSCDASVVTISMCNVTMLPMHPAPIHSTVPTFEPACASHVPCYMQLHSCQVVHAVKYAVCSANQEVTHPKSSRANEQLATVVDENVVSEYVTPLNLLTRRVTFTVDTAHAGCSRIEHRRCLLSLTKRPIAQALMYQTTIVRK
jgi:hypothetical protein